MPAAKPANTPPTTITLRDSPVGWIGGSAVEMTRIFLELSFSSSPVSLARFRKDS